MMSECHVVSPGLKCLANNPLLKLISLFGTSCSLYWDLFIVGLQRKDALVLGALKERLASALQKGIRQVVSSGRKDLAEVRSRPLSGELSTMCLYGFSCHAGSQRKAPIHGNQGLLKEARKKKKSLAEIKGIV